MQWEQGRNLKTATNSTTNTTVVSANKVDTEISQAYTYDADGIRTGKTFTTKIYKYSASTGGGVASVGDNVSEPNAISYVRYLYSTVTTAHSYITQNGKVVRETIGSGTTAKVLDFIYDESGKPFALTYTNGTAAPVTHYYVLNLQGDVVGLIDEDSALVAKYTYSAWGEIISVTNADGTAITSETNIANINPLRYRGYYYDTETGFYYLQSRYYDPVTHRFINADSIASTGQGFVGTNMFAYCLNNPVNMSDSRGSRPIWERDYGNGLVGSTDAGTGCPYNAPSPYSVGLNNQAQEFMSGAIYLSNAYETISIETVFGGYESGADTSALLLGGNNTPVVFYAQRASKWWKFDEYACGINFNTDGGSFAFGLGLTESTIGGCVDNQSLDIHLGANKLGYTLKYGVDYNNHSANGYSHAYFRPWTIAAACYLVYITGGAAAGALALGIA